MAIWNEAVHPRDDEGKFTYKGGGISKNSNEDKMQNRADILYPSMADKTIKKNYNNIGLGKYQNENLPIEDIFYPSMRTKKDERMFTGGAANTELWEDDKDFNKALEYLYPQEGSYSNRNADLGGPTKLGVTQSTYDWYNKRNNIPTQSVKNITKSEATKIYYDYFWKESGASNIKDKGLALMYFDAAVNHGPYYAKKYYKVEQLLHTIYKSLDKQTDKQHKRKEFYYLSPEIADIALSSLVELLDGEKISVNNTGIYTKEQQMKLNSKEKRQIAKKFKFANYQIPIGSELIFVKNPKNKCIVSSNNKVSYKNKEYSLSGLTIKLMQELKYSGTHYNGYAYWTYNNILLRDLSKNIKLINT